MKCARCKYLKNQGVRHALVTCYQILHLIVPGFLGHSLAARLAHNDESFSSLFNIPTRLYLVLL